MKSINDKNVAPVGNVFVGVWINVLLGQTKVHNEHHLVLLHAGPTIQVQITNFLRPLFMNNFRQSSTYNKKNRPADEEVLRLDVSGGKNTLIIKAFSWV